MNSITLAGLHQVSIGELADFIWRGVVEALDQAVVTRTPKGLGDRLLGQGGIADQVSDARFRRAGCGKCVNSATSSKYYPPLAILDSMREEVEKALEDVRPHLQADGGDVELVDVTEDGIVKVRFKGACVGCPMRQFTLQTGIGRVIKQRVPEVKEIVLV
jgi:Fe-S cluster biogenesis protein NfuA